MFHGIRNRLLQTPEQGDADTVGECRRDVFMSEFDDHAVMSGYLPAECRGSDRQPEEFEFR